MENLSEAEKRFREKLNDKQLNKYLKMKKIDAQKAEGKFPMGRGLKNEFTRGYSGIEAAHKNGSSRTFMKEMATALNPVGEGSRENLMNSVGFLTSKQRLLAKRSIGHKLMYGSIPAFGIYSIASNVANDAEISDYVADSLSIAGTLGGFRAGKAYGAMMSKGSGRLALTARMGMYGTAGAALGTAVAVGAVKGTADMMSNESTIAKYAKKTYSAASQGTMFGDIRNNNKTLTMRAAALQKMNQSAINDRSYLLGNEASILKGAGPVQ